MDNNQNLQNRPFWAPAEGHREQSLRARIEKINKLDDPTTSADEILFWGKKILYVLLAYSAILGFFCYWKNFEKSFPFWVAAFMSAALPLAIEFGKNYCTTWAIRKPFFNGISHVWSRASSFFMFLGLLLIGITTFIMSVRNSTVGAHQLSTLFSHERNASVFAPDTRTIDQQIAILQKNDDQLSLKTKKGNINWAAQPIKSENAKSLAALQDQRKVSIQQQRADWEKQQAFKSEQGNYVADLVLASGGWTELLQILLMVLRVACEKSLHSRLPHQQPINNKSGQHFEHTHTENGHETNRQPYFSSPNETKGSSPNPPYPTIQNNGRYTFFNRNEFGNVEPAPDYAHKKTVSHSPLTVTRCETEMPANYADDVLRLAEKEIRGHAANFRDRQRKESTISDNINRILDETLEKIASTGFTPTRAAGAKFYGYLIGELFPLLNEKGRPYSRDIIFCKRMLAVIPPAET